MNQDVGIGMLIGLWIGAIIVTIAVIIVWPAGSKNISEDCLSDKPNICRTITTYTTPYKEEK